ncbi:MAG: Hsp20/alpha crystallin family protein [Gammaproteobacteria bacterium]|nr:Hsp20/alpha crystallin family protein [Gammaproteobacteria bacterium]TVQ48289.1 MAG: Hsp20/alpha crystallin family protein [Gammaproteobacteria bacterium]
MTTVRYEPFEMMNDLHGRLQRLFEGQLRQEHDDSSAATADWVPAVDIQEFSDRFVLQVDLPGVNPESVELTLDRGVLTLSGQREKPAREDLPARERRERGLGRFHRRFILPETVDAEGVCASGRLGVLEIEIPKQAKAQPRRIQVAA